MNSHRSVRSVLSAGTRYSCPFAAAAVLCVACGGSDSITSVSSTSHENLASVPLEGEASGDGVELGSTSAAAGGVVSITGSFRLPPAFEGLFTERFVALADLTAFVLRDPGRALPREQVVGAPQPDDGAGQPFRLSLPIEPEGTLHRLSDAPGAGVKVFAVVAQTNIVGDFTISAAEMTGWASDLTSVLTADGSREVSGGRVLAWSPDGSEFPVDFGADGRLFTADDPLAPLELGWTVIDLDRLPFERLRDSSVPVPIHNGELEQDLSALSYTAAFDALTAELGLRYPYTDVKGLDWAAIRAELRPRVVAAEAAGDALAFDLALAQLAVAMNDGHSLATAPVPVLIERYGAGVGLRLAQTDVGEVLVTRLDPGSAADRAGIRVGAAITRWSGLDIDAALDGVERLQSDSTSHARRLRQLALLPRSPIGASTSVGFRNPGASAESSVELGAEEDLAGAFAALFGDPGDPLLPPVSAELLPSGIGYVKVTSFFDDQVLMSHSWDWALRMFNALEAPALIVDMRGNGGGANPLGAYFAGSFYREPFVRSRQYAADATGAMVWKRDDLIQPSPLQWQRPVAVLIDARCVSVGEEFVAAMAADPDHLIVGSSPSGGVEGEVAFWALPDGLTFQASLGMYRYPDGALFIEGSGVEPNVHVPVTRESLLSAEDAVLNAAIQALSERAAAVPAGDE